MVVISTLKRHSLFNDILLNFWDSVALLLCVFLNCHGLHLQMDMREASTYSNVSIWKVWCKSHGTHCQVGKKGRVFCILEGLNGTRRIQIWIDIILGLWNRLCGTLFEVCRSGPLGFIKKHSDVERRLVFTSAFISWAPLSFDLLHSPPQQYFQPLGCSLISCMLHSNAATHLFYLPTDCS